MVMSVFTPPSPFGPIATPLALPPVSRTFPVTFMVRFVAPGVFVPFPPIRAPAKLPVLADPVSVRSPFTAIV